MKYGEILKAMVKVESDESVFGCKMRDINSGSIHVASSLMGLYELMQYVGMKPGWKCVEMGSWCGDSTVLFAQSGAEISAVDAWSNAVSDIKDFEKTISEEKFHEIEALFDKNVKDYPNIKKMKMTSVDAANLIPNDSLDFVYIDGSHNKVDSALDISLWSMKVKPGGWLCGHDIALNGVAMSVAEAYDKAPKVFRDTSWAIKREKDWGITTWLGTGVNREYLPKAYPYLTTLNNVVKNAWVKKFCITVGFKADAVLQNTFPEIQFIYLDINDIKAFNKNYCIQHGEFLKVLPAKDEDIIIFTDADIIIQRDIGVIDYINLCALADNEICLGPNAGDFDTLEIEHNRLEPKVYPTVVEKYFNVNLGLAPVYNTGVVSCNKKTYQRWYDAYIEHYSFIEEIYGHYAKQQFLMSLLIYKHFIPVYMDKSVHTHGHYGIPPFAIYREDVYTVPTRYLTGCAREEIVLFRHALPRQKIVLKMVYTDTGGCLYYRVMHPHLKLVNRYDSRYQLLGDLGISEEESRKADIIFMQRTSDLPMFFAVKNALKPGAKIVWDGDDDYFDVHRTNRLGFPGMKPSNQEGVGANIKNADAVVVSTEYLKKYFTEKLKLTQPVYVMPNTINFEVWDKWYNRKKINDKLSPEPFVRIGWHGGCSHDEDIKSFAPVVMELIKKYGNRIRFYTCGHPWTQFDEYKDVSEYFKMLYWYNDTEQFGKNLVEFDIGIAPLDLKVGFNKSKSNIKFLEYSALGIPTVASDCEPYGEIENGVTGFKIKDNDQKTWVDTLSKLIEDKIYRDEIAGKAREYAKKNYNDLDWIDKWDSMYREVLGR